MAHFRTPHYHNTAGHSVVQVGTREFMCIGARPPFDHPHVFLDMGDENDLVCPYCSTLYRYDPALEAGEARPAECVWHAEPAVAI